MNFEATIHVRSEESGGEVSVIEITVPAGFDGPPLHHHDFDEAFFVLDGELTFQVEQSLEIRRAGEFIFAPRGVVHAVANLSDAPARYLLVCTPAGFERRFDPDADEPIPEVTVVGPVIRESGLV